MLTVDRFVRRRTVLVGGGNVLRYVQGGGNCPRNGNIRGISRGNVRILVLELAFGSGCS